jgi:putative transposase
MDWMYDELFDGRRIWVLTIVDNFGRVSPVLWAGFQAKAADVVGALNKAAAEFGTPKRIRVDNGSQFTSKEVDLWAYANNVVLDFSRPGKPTDNAFIDQHWFLDIDDARSKIEAWRQDYNHVRPHGAIGNQVPMDIIRSSPQACLRGWRPDL